MKNQIKKVGDILNDFSNVTAYHIEKSNQKEVEYIVYEEQIAGIHFANNRSYDVGYNVNFTYYCKSFRDYKHIDFIAYVTKNLNIKDIDLVIDKVNNRVIVNGVVGL